MITTVVGVGGHVGQASVGHVGVTVGGQVVGDSVGEGGGQVVGEAVGGQVEGSGSVSPEIASAWIYHCIFILLSIL